MAQKRIKQFKNLGFKAYVLDTKENIDEIRNITAKLIVVYDLDNESQIEALVPNYKRYFGNYV